MQAHSEEADPASPFRELSPRGADAYQAVTLRWEGRDGASIGAEQLEILPVCRVHEGWVAPDLFSTAPAAAAACCLAQSRCPVSVREMND